MPPGVNMDMDMKKIGESLPAALERARSRVKQNKGYNRYNLWIRISHSLAKDGHLKNISGNELKVLIYLCSYMDKNKIAFPSLDTIADDTGLGKNTVQSVLKRLTHKGWLAKIGRVNNPNGKYGNMQYQILERDLIRSSGDPNFLMQPVTKIGNG